MENLVLPNDVAQLRHRSQQVISTLPVIPRDLPEMPEIVLEGPRQFEQNIRGVLRHLKKVLKALKRAGAHESLDKVIKWRQAVQKWHDVVQESPETFVEYERTGRMPSPEVTFTPYSSLNAQQQPSTPAHSEASSTLLGSSDDSAPSSNDETEHESHDSSHDPAPPASFEFTFPESGAAPSELYVFSSSEESAHDDELSADLPDAGAREHQQSVSAGQESEDREVPPEEDDVATMTRDEEGVAAEETITAEEGASGEVGAQESVAVKEPQHDIGTSTSSNSSGYTLPQTGIGLSHVFVWMESQESAEEDGLLEETSVDTWAQEALAATEQDVTIEEPVVIDSEASLGNIYEEGAGEWVCDAANNSVDHSAESAVAGSQADFISNEGSAAEDSTLLEDLTSEAEKAEEDSEIMPEGSLDAGELAGGSNTVHTNLTSTFTTAADEQTWNDGGKQTATVPIHFSRMSPTSILVGATAGALMVARFPVVSACMLYAGIAYAKYSLNH
ncbi:hypothetical protein LTR10_015420 [Elasticomyces elasticus]|uniref:Uncharacterized protein n=1 Tax=Exophiala sideris TaxID=1016849 RepID=A0ABR0J5L8_9EURO|nr:hypothetical protein LTR10_015420 [Elasticomyces elasticus]KAK5026988.1 hypothetical protein LTS07_007287 [Exophiala sideris]KAK5033992.1 hypothetical protein LTR13_006592 [Exophiala sideris]KAK5055734.1 hypothetical protein LTR69_008109 [Exophiala sideris]KAK5180934.1 hypothetical protein LTR44_006754 [Eurotiomycetes sp. CCFEE 6388]